MPITKQTYHNRKLRRRVLSKYGSVCFKCGFSDQRALQLDHVNGGGVKEIKKMGSYAVYRKALKDTEGLYQLLCANCNWIKRYENLECNNQQPF